MRVNFSAENSIDLNKQSVARLMGWRRASGDRRRNIRIKQEVPSTIPNRKLSALMALIVIMRLDQWGVLLPGAPDRAS